MGSIAPPTGQLRQWLAADIAAVLKLPIKFQGLKTNIPIGQGYVIIHALTWETVTGRQASVRKLAHESRFRITVVRPWPSGELLIQELKEQDQEALLPVLQPESHYHEIGHFPTVAQASFEEEADELERVCKYMLEWVVITYEEHHPDPNDGA